MRKLVLISFLVCAFGYAQNKQVLYDFASLPQTLLLNPGAEVGHKFHVGLPLLSQLSVQAGFTGFSVYDIFADDGIDINDKIRNAFSANSFINNFTDEISNTDVNGTVILQENLNSLGLDKVYFITTYSTASASELVINSLSSYIDVKVVGKTTRGKQVGSITLYDSDNLQRNGNNLNPNHRYAIQPLVFEISNKDNKNYPNGIVPGETLPGVELGEDYSNLGVLGERSDPLLDRTLVYITTGAKSSNNESKTFDFNEIFNSKLATPAKDNMFMDLKK